MGKAEAYVEKYLVSCVESAGGQARKARWIAVVGCPDRRVSLPKRCAWVECKKDGGDLSPMQEREFKRMIKHGEIIYVVSTREEVDLFMQGKLAPYVPA